MTKKSLHNAFGFATLAAFIFSNSVCASETFSTYFASHEKGWHWYDDPKMQADDESDLESGDDPNVDEMTAVQTAIHRAMNKAVLHPTKENVKNYIALQEKMTAQASQFSSTWQAVLLENPKLDYSVTHPVSNMGRRIIHDEASKREDEAIQKLAQNSGLFFFYRSTCPYCRAFAPTVKQFSELYGVRVKPITTDGVFLPEFPDSRVDQGQAAKFHVTAEPALFAVNPRTHKAVPVGFGLMSMADLRARILQIATHFDGNVPS